jgi:putative transposase
LSSSLGRQPGWSGFALETLTSPSRARRERTPASVWSIGALYRCPVTIKPEPGYKIYPYLLRGAAIATELGLGDRYHLRPDGAWLVQVAVVVDWFSRRVLGWRVSMDRRAST